MRRPFAVRIAAQDASALSDLRLSPGLKICEAGDDLWLQGTLDDRESDAAADDASGESEADKRLDLTLRKLPGADRYWILPDGQLQPMGFRLPRGYLPSGRWLSLRDFLLVVLPLHRWGTAEGIRRHKLQLVRQDSATAAEAPAAPTLLVTRWSTWRSYAIVAPQVRLDRWTFAAAADDRVLIRGAPLPPLPGTRFEVRQRVAVPYGWRWSPAVDPEVVREAAGAGEAELVLLTPQKLYRVSDDAFVHGSRASIRATEAALQAGRSPPGRTGGSHA